MGDGELVVAAIESGDSIPMGGEGFDKVGVIGVEVIGMAADAMPTSGKEVGNQAFG